MIIIDEIMVRSFLIFYSSDSSALPSYLPAYMLWEAARRTLMSSGESSRRVLVFFQFLIFNLKFFPSRETSEVLAYDAAQVQDGERVRPHVEPLYVFFIFLNFDAIGSLVAPPPPSLSLPPTGGRGRGVPEVQQGAVAGAGRRHLPPHEDVVSASIGPAKYF